MEAFTMARSATKPAATPEFREHEAAPTTTSDPTVTLTPVKRSTFQLPESIEVRETVLVKPSRTVGERKPRETHNAFTEHVAANWANHKDDEVAVEFACAATDETINGYRNAIYRGARSVKDENGETGKVSVKIQIGNYDDDGTFHKMTTPKADAHWPTLGADTVVIKFKAIAKSDKPRKPKDDAATSAS